MNALFLQILLKKSYAKQLLPLFGEYWLIAPSYGITAGQVKEISVTTAYPFLSQFGFHKWHLGFDEHQHVTMGKKFSSKGRKLISTTISHTYESCNSNSFFSYAIA